LSSRASPARTSTRKNKAASPQFYLASVRAALADGGPADPAQTVECANRTLIF